MKELYCPKCGGILDWTADGTLRCHNGPMAFAKELSERLKACYIDETRRPDGRPANYKVGEDDLCDPEPSTSRWFCPACGCQVQSTARQLICPRCQRSLNEFLYSLVERHPHPDGKGGWM